MREYNVGQLPLFAMSLKQQVTENTANFLIGKALCLGYTQLLPVEPAENKSDET